MDLLDSILNSMDKPPSASEAQRTVMKKQKEAFEKKQRDEKIHLSKFRIAIEEKLSKFIKDPCKQSLPFESMDKVYRAIIHDVAEIAGLQVYSYGEDGVDRYSVVYHKEGGPTDDEVTVRRSGGVWNMEKAKEMEQKRIEQQQIDLENEQHECKSRGRKRLPVEISGTHYKQKYAHLIGEDAAIDAAHKTNTNKSYGEVPSENKKDIRSIEQTMADIQAKKRKKLEEQNLNQEQS